MKAEIISVGTELLLGSTINTDAADVAVLLSEYGINVYWQTVVGDNPGRVAEAVRRARERADLIITTGGLGPTCDDLTKSALAEGFGMEAPADDPEEECESMTQAAFEAMYNKVNPLYKSIDDVPEYWQQEVRAMLDCGAIDGGTADDPNDVNMRQEALKAAIVAYRAARDK